MKVHSNLLCAAAAAIVLFGPAAWAATPAGERGGRLTAAEEAQQQFLRRLRQEIAVQRVLSRHLADQPLGNAGLPSAPPVVPTDLLARCSQDGISPATLSALQSYRAQPLPEHSTAATADSGTASCSKAVAACFQKLGVLFEAQFGEPLSPESVVVTTNGAAVPSPQGT